jgi:molybdopterin converting factor subunit 1
MSGTVKVLAFAGARDVVGTEAITWPLAASCTSAEFLESLCTAFPRLSPYRSSLRLAINGRYATSDDVVRDGDEIALIPPVAGG